jgi:regulator of replication initiation timing
VSSVDRVHPEGVDRPEDAVRRLLRLKKAIARSRATLAAEVALLDPASLSKRAGDIATEMGLWEESLEDIRVELAELIAESDRWRIAHDKLRERIDRHALEPRTEVESPPRSAKIATPRAQAASGESQDFSAIDLELERLNASMLAAFSSE